MKYVEFYEVRSGEKKLLGQVSLEEGKLVISEGLAQHWRPSWSYGLLGQSGFDKYYDPEKILEALSQELSEPGFEVSEVKTL